MTSIGCRCMGWKHGGMPLRRGSSSRSLPSRISSLTLAKRFGRMPERRGLRRSQADRSDLCVAYADAVALYWHSLLATTESALVMCTGVKAEGSCKPFARQALPMIWDFAEANPFLARPGTSCQARLCVGCEGSRRVPARDTETALHQLDARRAGRRPRRQLSSRTRRTTTTSVTPIFPTSSTCGFGAR